MQLIILIIDQVIRSAIYWHSHMPLKPKCFLYELISTLANFIPAYEGKSLLNVLIQSQEFVSWNMARHLTVTDLITLVSLVTGSVKHLGEFTFINVHP